MTALLSALLIGAAPASAQTTCAGLDGTHGDPDLRCIDLVAAPGASGRAAGRIELRVPGGPFTVAVTPTGQHVWRLVASLALPDASTFGASTYVAWATTPMMHPLIRLGAVRDGTTDIGTVGLDKFIVLISAEAADTVSERRGPLVLRGTSPSMLMQPDHMPVLLSEAARGAIQSAHAVPADGPGAQAPPADAGQDEHHAHPPAAPHGAHPRVDPPGEPGGTWPHPAMPADIVMLPGMMPRLPKVSPYAPDLPEAALDSGRTGRDAAGRRAERLSPDAAGASGPDLRLAAEPRRTRIAGIEATGWSYNGGSPGPTLHVDQGSRLDVRYVNRTELPSTVHWHGLRLENRFDGVPGLTQELVMPGDSFDYQLVFPDAGTFWYHPHHREDIAQDLGLYGNILVRPTTDDAPNAVDREYTLMLDDVLTTRDGTTLMPHGREAATHALMGRFGDALLVNGRSDWSATVSYGQVVRFLLTNAANTRTFNLSFGVDSVKLVGGDVGLYLDEHRVTSVPIAPAERYAVEVRYDRPGTYAITNRVMGIDHVVGAFVPRVDTVGTVVVTAGGPEPGAEPAAAFDRLRTLPRLADDIERFRPHFDRAVDRTLRLRLQADSLPFPLDRLMRLDSAYFHPVEWDGTMPDMNWILSSDDIAWVLEDAATGATNEDIDWSVHTGDVIKIRIRNERGSLHAMQHPIHLHGQRFLIVEQDGVRNDALVWKDTVLVPVGSYVDLLVDFSNPGQWMLHCHIAEHLEAGMRMVVDVQPPGS